MAESNQIQKLNFTHERILDWLLQNPDKSMRECADTFGYTQAWLSTVVNSDAFQVQWKALSGNVHSRVVADVPARMQRIAEVALDKLADAVASSEDKDFILETSDKILHRMGYAPKASGAKANGVMVVNNTFTVSAGDLAEARGNFGRVEKEIDMPAGETGGVLQLGASANE